jgi:hypothetical protein
VILVDLECCNKLCGRLTEALVNSAGEAVVCPSCGALTRRVPSRVSVVIQSNMGKKLRTRVALDDELKKQGFSAPLFSSEARKDKARWALRKAGIG